MVFIGKVISVQQEAHQVAKEDGSTATFEVISSWKRAAKKPVVVASPRHCGLRFKTGSTWLIYAHEREGNLYTRLLGGSTFLLPPEGDARPDWMMLVPGRFDSLAPLKASAPAMGPGIPPEITELESAAALEPGMTVPTSSIDKDYLPIVETLAIAVVLTGGFLTVYMVKRKREDVEELEEPN